MKKLLFSSVLFLFLVGYLSATTVYVTKTGKKYHSSECSSLSRSSIPIDLKDAQNKGYTPRSKCSPTTGDFYFNINTNDKWEMNISKR